MSRECRGLRFSFNADAEIAPDTSPKAIVPGRVTELSFQDCFLETSASLEFHRQLLLNIHDSSEFFDPEAVVLYTRPSGLVLIFHELKPRSSDILHNTIIKA